MASGQLQARLRNFEFNHDIRNLLPAEVRRWYEEHELAGRVDIPEVTFTPGRREEHGHFKVESVLNGVSLTVQPREWLSRAENRRLQEIRNASDLMRRAGMNFGGDIDHFASVIEPAPIKLDNVTGKFIFTEDGIDVQDLTGRVEANALKINGHIDGYSPDAPIHLRLSSLESENLFIPPRSQLHPLAAGGHPRDLHPPSPHRHVQPLGRGRSPHARFPPQRPRRGADSRWTDGLRFLPLSPCATSPAASPSAPMRTLGMDRCDIRDVRGLGIAGGPNANVPVIVNASIFLARGGAEVKVRVVADNVVSEEALRKAMPDEVKDVMKMFDPGGKGEYPQFRGSFVCEVHRAPGPNQKWPGPMSSSP